MAQAAPQELVIAVLVHGFKGGADTSVQSSACCVVTD